MAATRAQWFQAAATRTLEADGNPMKSPSKLFFKPRRRIPVSVSLRAVVRVGADGSHQSNAGDIELSGDSLDSGPEINSKDSQTLPRPLTRADLYGAGSGSGLRVAFQGLLGAYSESAAEKAYPNCEAVPCDSSESAFDAVENWCVDRAVLPIESSRGGSIHRNYDLLLRHKLHIVGEVKYAVRYCLLANHGVKIEHIKRVLSHPQALSQCEHSLTKLGVVRENVDDTAGAAKFIADNKLEDAAAVASSLAAEIYGLNILAQDIQDDAENVTRFLILAREPIIPGADRPFKTSIVFSLEEGPGVLFKALAVFALREINLSKIESRPQQRRPLRGTEDGSNGPPKYFDYLFYVDFEASMASPSAQNALKHLKGVGELSNGHKPCIVRLIHKQSYFRTEVLWMREKYNVKRAVRWLNADSEFTGSKSVRIHYYSYAGYLFSKSTLVGRRGPSVRRIKRLD